MYAVKLNRGKASHQQIYHSTPECKVHTSIILKGRAKNVRGMPKIRVQGLEFLPACHAKTLPHFVFTAENNVFTAGA